ncbi:helix-turn-helix domain-containing protein [Nonomuraea sp. ZG12]|uniref:helix-turn-helix domain-containing protein n=1 Tax=Nonomuraea sp. ZG12 TaxID=3452207 RepID=UPI003F8B1F58
MDSSKPDRKLEALSARLRDIRQDAGLQGRELASLAGWHPSKVSRIELAKQRPSEEDIVSWCRHCGAVSQQDDLVTLVRTIEAMYVELRRKTKTGLKHFQESFTPLWQNTLRFRIYEPAIVPGLIQTEEYSRAVLTLTADRLGGVNDIDEAVAARAQRQSVLYERTKRFVALIEEQALLMYVGDPDVMLGQLDRLLAIMESPRFSLGIIPMMRPRHAWPSEGFWIYDESTVMVETRSAVLTINQLREIAVYADVFERLKSSAAFGQDARDLIKLALQKHSAQSRAIS